MADPRDQRTPWAQLIIIGMIGVVILLEML